jgi:hypothetical protein
MRFTPTLPTISMPSLPSPSASARISRASNLVSSQDALTTAIPSPLAAVIFTTQYIGLWANGAGADAHFRDSLDTKRKRYQKKADY